MIITLNNYRKASRPQQNYGKKNQKTDHALNSDLFAYHTSLKINPPNLDDIHILLLTTQTPAFIQKLKGAPILFSGQK